MALFAMSALTRAILSAANVFFQGRISSICSAQNRRKEFPERRRKLLVLCLAGTLRPCILIIIRHLCVTYCGSLVARNVGMARVRSQHFWSRQASKYVIRNDRVWAKANFGPGEIAGKT